MGLEKEKLFASNTIRLHCKNKCVVSTHLMCVNQCPHFLHGFSCVVFQHTKMCVVLVLNINDNYTLTMMLRIITIYINIILLQKKTKKKESCRICLSDIPRAGFEPGTFELPILTYLTIWHALTILAIRVLLYSQVFYYIYPRRVEHRLSFRIILLYKKYIYIYL